MLVESGHRVVRHINVGDNAPKVRALEPVQGLLVLNEVTLLKESRGNVSDIGAHLDEIIAAVSVIHADIVESGIFKYKDNLWSRW